MQGLFLHLDEELTNKRPGRISGVYNLADIAFWLQFYSLFNDKVFIPANHIIDCNLVPEFLTALRFKESDSPLNSESSVVHLLWDEQRFPYSNFMEMIRDIEGGNTDVSMRDMDKAKHSALIADEHFKGLVVRTDMSSGLKPNESVYHLKREIFNPDKNWALDEELLGKLHRCVEFIEKRGSHMGYGRNFYYSIFGYGQAKREKDIATHYSDIIQNFISIKHKFLTGVDYVSHCLKAHQAAKALGQRIDFLMPSDFLWIVCPPDKTVDKKLGPMIPSRIELNAKSIYRRIITREVIVNMTVSQLSSLHESPEYREYKISWNELRKRPYKTNEEKRVATMEKSLNAYLERISATLNPKRNIGNKAIGMFVRNIPTFSGLSVSVILKVLGHFIGLNDLVKDSKKTLTSGIEIYSKSIADKVIKKTADREKLPFHSYQSSEDVTVYMGIN